jgi:hypothetical protein
MKAPGAEGFGFGFLSRHVLAIHAAWILYVNLPNGMIMTYNDL